MLHALMKNVFLTNQCAHIIPHTYHILFYVKVDNDCFKSAPIETEDKPFVTLVNVLNIFFFTKYLYISDGQCLYIIFINQECSTLTPQEAVHKLNDQDGLTNGIIETLSGQYKKQVHDIILSMSIANTFYIHVI